MRSKLGGENLNIHSNIQSKITRREWLFLTITFCILVAIKFLWIKGTPAPWLFFDEVFYRQYAYDIFYGLGYKISGYYNAQYPPLYPLVIAPAFFFGNNWYKAILSINVLISSTIIFPIYLIVKRFFSSLLSWFIVLLTVMSGFNVVFPRMLMSENLYLPLFLFCFLLLIWEYKQPVFDLLFGFLLGLCFLTRYLSLPLIPIFFILKFIQPWYTKRISFRKIFSLRLLFQRLLIFLGAIVALLPWLIYSKSVGFPLKNAFGFGISGMNLTNSNAPDISYLPLWTGAYLLLVLFGCSLFLDDFLSIIFQRYSRNEKSFTILSFFVITAVLILVCGVFFWQSSGNDFSNSFFHERYILGIFLLVPIVAFLVQERIRILQDKNQGKGNLIAVMGLAIGIVIICYATLVTKALWSDVPNFAIFNVQTAAWYVETWMTPAKQIVILNGSLLLVIVILVYIFRFLYRGFHSLRFLVIVELVFITMFSIISDFYLARGLQINEDLGKGAMQLSNAILSNPISQPKVNIYLDDKLMQDQDRIVWILRFNGIWNFQIDEASKGSMRKGYLVTSLNEQFPKISSYISNGEVFAIHRIP